ncbi:MAG: UbiA family prenyltransferase [Planctomycetota bacterium]
MIGQYVKAWLELGRISNLPTVWSNVVHGLSVGWFVSVLDPQRLMFGYVEPIGWLDLGWLLNQAFLLLVGMSLLYTAGMVLNDACDVSIDQQERPERPIPSGRITRREAFVGAVVMLGLGWGCTLVYPPAVSLWAGVLVVAIVGYNLLHRWRWAGLVLMPTCRGLVIFLSASAFTAGVGIDADLPRVLGSVLAIGCYTLIITLIAWGEALPSMGKLARWVGVMIAGMALIDAGFVLLLGLWPIAVLCVGCGAAAFFGQRWIRGS